MTAVLRRDDEEMTLDEPDMLHSGRLLSPTERSRRFDDGGAFALVSLFRDQENAVRAAKTSCPRCSRRCTRCRACQRSSCPRTAASSPSDAAPQPCVTIPPDPAPWRATLSSLAPVFATAPCASRARSRDADGLRSGNAHGAPSRRRVRGARRARDSLRSARKKSGTTASGTKTSRHCRRTARTHGLDLVGAGWHVEADGAVYRAAGRTRATVTSGIDWFELDAGVRYGDIEVSLTICSPRGARARRRIDLVGRQSRRHPDRLARAPRSARRRRHARGRRPALHAVANRAARRAARYAFPRPTSTRRSRKRARRASRRSIASHRSIRRPRFAARCASTSAKDSAGSISCATFGLGGCLADDMGLGKTVQVLALLDSRRTRARRRAGASVDRRRAAFARVQLDARGASASRRSFACSTTRAPGRRNRAIDRWRHRRRDHDVRHAAPRRRAALPRSRSTTRFSTRRRRSRTPARRRPRRRGCCAPTTGWR